MFIGATAKCSPDGWIDDCDRKYPAKYPRGPFRKPPTSIVIHRGQGPGNIAKYFSHCSDGRKVSAHFAVQKDGSIYQCVSLNSGAYHAGSPWNASSIGIEHQGPIGSDWPQPQCIALVNLVDFLVGHYPTIKQIVFHSVISQTHIDPGVNFPQYIVSVWRSIGLDVVTKKTKPT